jgi:hypothetical protein
VTREGDDRRFRLRGWPAAAGGGAPYEALSDDRAALRATAVGLLAGGGYSRLDLAAWSDELNDWIRLERFEPR